MKPIRCYYRDGKNLAVVEVDYFYDNYTEAIKFVKIHTKFSNTVLALVNKGQISSTLWTNTNSTNKT